AQGPAPPRREGPVRPIVAWPPGPLEVIVAVDQPLDPAAATAMVGRTIASESPRGDRPHGPGASGPTGPPRIVRARPEADGPRLILATDPHARAARYLLRWREHRPEPRSKDRPVPTIAYDLSGLEAAWYAGDAPAAEPTWSTWWPSLDLDATRQITG